MTTITVVCREMNSSTRDMILMYAVNVANPNDQNEVETAVTQARADDLGEAIEMEILFALAGDVNAVADWRE